MERISKAFGNIIRDLGIEKAVSVEILRRKWQETLGETIAQHTCPISHQRGQLLINVDSPEWLHELQYHRDNVIEKLKPLGFNNIRFKLGKVHQTGSKLSLNRTLSKPTEQDSRFAKDLTSTIEDRHLRENIRKAIETSLVSRTSP